MEERESPRPVLLPHQEKNPKSMRRGSIRKTTLSHLTDCVKKGGRRKIGRSGHNVLFLLPHGPEHQLEQWLQKNTVMEFPL